MGQTEFLGAAALPALEQQLGAQRHDGPRKGPEREDPEPPKARWRGGAAVHQARGRASDAGHMLAPGW